MEADKRAWKLTPCCGSLLHLSVGQKGKLGIIFSPHKGPLLAMSASPQIPPVLVVGIGNQEKPPYEAKEEGKGCVPLSNKTLSQAQLYPGRGRGGRIEGKARSGPFNC